ncbi:hypothetical protein R3P38DRAFT_3186523 [Favolaschia claudopus]|uniref:Uncharacterized protein n=1 Tax=Favolaschia claudopus TaxID=2862362 RepID=A0AAW0C392_9AGAR
MSQFFAPNTSSALFLLLSAQLALREPPRSGSEQFQLHLPCARRSPRCFRPHHHVRQGLRPPPAIELAVFTTTVSPARVFNPSPPPAAQPTPNPSTTPFSSRSPPVRRAAFVDVTAFVNLSYLSNTRHNLFDVPTPPLFCRQTSPSETSTPLSTPPNLPPSSYAKCAPNPTMKTTHPHGQTQTGGQSRRGGKKFSPTLSTALWGTVRLVSYFFLWLSN